MTPYDVVFFISYPSPNGDKLSISTSVPCYQFSRLKETATLRTHGQCNSRHWQQPPIEERKKCWSLYVRLLSSQPISDCQIGDRILYEGAVYFVHDRGLGSFRFMTQSLETPRIMFTKSTQNLIVDDGHKSIIFRCGSNCFDLQRLVHESRSSMYEMYSTDWRRSIGSESIWLNVGDVEFNREIGDLIPVLHDYSPHPCG
jgi:hypothetical protein